MYTTKEAVRQVLAPDDERLGTAAELEDEDIDEAIDRVSGRIDTFLTRRYTVPLTAPVPGIIRDIATDIAAYDLTLAYYKGTDLQDTDPVIRRYKDARGMLGQLSTGLLVIDVPGANQVTDDPIVINPAPLECSPFQGFEVRVVRELGWGHHYGS